MTTTPATILIRPAIPGGLSLHGRRCDPAVNDCTWWLLGPLLAVLAASVICHGLALAIGRVR